MTRTSAPPNPEEAVSPKDLIRRMRASYLARHFGFTVELAEPRHVILRMRIRERHKQSRGFVHGGILAALADTAGGLATFFSVPKGARVATVEMKINYLEPVESGTVRAEARVLRVGRNLVVVDCELLDHARMVCKALMTFTANATPGPFDRDSA